MVLLLDLDEDGALGVVLNRPSPVPVDEVLPGWSDVVAGPDVLFQGGPVGTDSALAVGACCPGGRRNRSASAAMFGTTGIVDLDAPTEIIAPRGARHAASSPATPAGGAGQLRGRDRGGLLVRRAGPPDDLFGTDPASLWSRVLRRQPGELAWVSTRPADPALN